MATAPLPKGVQLKAGGAAFVHLAIPTRAVYVGESVPVDIELGLRPGIVTSLNGLPTLNGGEFTLNNLSQAARAPGQSHRRQPLPGHDLAQRARGGETGRFLLVGGHAAHRENQYAIGGGYGLRSLAGRPVPAKHVQRNRSERDVTITSPASELKVLPLPTEGRPKDFSGAVGDFQVSSDISPARAAAGDPLTLRLHVSGAGNFDRVDSTMFDHLDHWKTYPAKSSFTPSDAVGYKGEKVFEQPLIAAQPGEQSIPGLELQLFQSQHATLRARAHAPNQDDDRHLAGR